MHPPARCLLPPLARSASSPGNRKGLHTQPVSCKLGCMLARLVSLLFCDSLPCRQAPSGPACPARPARPARPANSPAGPPCPSRRGTDPTGCCRTPALASTSWQTAWCLAQLPAPRGGEPERDAGAGGPRAGSALRPGSRGAGEPGSRRAGRRGRCSALSARVGRERSARSRPGVLQPPTVGAHPCQGTGSSEGLRPEQRHSRQRMHRHSASEHTVTCNPKKSAP